MLDPVKLVIDNYPDGRAKSCFAPNHPQKPELGKRTLPLLARALDRARGLHRKRRRRATSGSSPGNSVRLRYGYVVKCTGCEKDADGKVTVVHCNYSRYEIGTPGAEAAR